MPVPAGTFFYYLAPWALLSDPDLGDHWIPPAGTNGLIDLRPLPAQGTTAFTAGFGFFACDPAAVPEGGLLLGDDLATPLTAQMRADAEAMLELSPGDLGEATMLDDLFRVLTDLSDPTGQNRVKPLMPTVALNMDIHLGGHSLVKRVRFDPLVHTKSIDLLRLDYDRIKQEARARGDNELYLRVAGYWEKKYGFDVRSTDQQRDGIRAPQTTITDDFNGTDSDTFGVDLSWTEINGDWDVTSNQGGLATVEGTTRKGVRAESDLSSDDHYAQIDVTVLTGGSGTRILGPCARFDAASTSHLDSEWYSAQLVDDNNFYTIKNVDNTITTLGGPDAQTVSLPDTLKVQADGSTIKGFFNGSEIHSVTDSALTGHLRTGLQGIISTGLAYASTGDNFEAADLAVGAAPVRRQLMTLGVGR